MLPLFGKEGLGEIFKIYVSLPMNLLVSDTKSSQVDIHLKKEVRFLDIGKFYAILYCKDCSGKHRNSKNFLLFA